MACLSLKTDQIRPQASAQGRGFGPSTRLAGPRLSARAQSPKAITLYHLFGEQFHRLEWNQTIPFKPILL
jgi:hypothetical protein